MFKYLLFDDVYFTFLLYFYAFGWVLKTDPGIYISMDFLFYSLFWSSDKDENCSWIELLWNVIWVSNIQHIQTAPSNPNIESSHPKFKQKINSKLNNSTEIFQWNSNIFTFQFQIFPIKSSEIQMNRKQIAHLLTLNWKSRQENNAGNIKFSPSPKMVNNGESEKE